MTTTTDAENLADQLRSASKEADRRFEMHQAAKQHLEATIQRVISLDESVNLDDYIRAIHAVDFTRYRHNGAQQVVARIQSPGRWS